MANTPRRDKSAGEWSRVGGDAGLSEMSATSKYRRSKNVTLKFKLRERLTWIMSNICGAEGNSRYFKMKSSSSVCAEEAAGPHEPRSAFTLWKVKSCYSNPCLNVAAGLQRCHFKRESIQTWAPAVISSCNSCRTRAGIEHHVAWAWIGSLYLFSDLVSKYLHANTVTNNRTKVL